jgi:hypothetical protein
MYEMKKSVNGDKTCCFPNGGNKSIINKILWLSIILFLFAGLVPAVVNAHAPKSMTLAYDAGAKVLKVTILHPSPMPSWHYIKSVTVERNKQPLASYPYQSQKGDEFTYSYEIIVVPGDILVVNVFCSMYGSRTEMIKIPETKNP